MLAVLCLLQAGAGTEGKIGGAGRDRRTLATFQYMNGFVWAGFAISEQGDGAFLGLQSW